MKCPVCGSTKLRKVSEKSMEMRCDKCGYVHSEKVRGKIILSRTGGMEENWWMR